MSPANNLTHSQENRNTPPAAPPLTPLTIFHTFIDLDRAGDITAAALAIGDCIMSLSQPRREVVIELVGHCALLEYGEVAK